jgi:hypothetical protein
VVDTVGGEGDDHLDSGLGPARRAWTVPIESED